MLSLVDGMDAVSYKQRRNLTVCLGYQILMSSGMDAVNLTLVMLAFVNGMDAAVITQLGCVMEQQRQQQHFQGDAFVLRVALVLIAINEAR